MHQQPPMRLWSAGGLKPRALPALGPEQACWGSMQGCALALLSACAEGLTRSHQGQCRDSQATLASLLTLHSSDLASAACAGALSACVLLLSPRCRSTLNCVLQPGLCCRTQAWRTCKRRRTGCWHTPTSSSAQHLSSAASAARVGQRGRLRRRRRPGGCAGGGQRACICCVGSTAG